MNVLKDRLREPRLKLWPRDPASVLWPDSVEVFPNYLRVGDRVVRSYVVTGFPREVSPGWLTPLLEFPHPLVLGFQQAPLPNDVVLAKMARRLTWHQGSENANAAMGRLSNPLSRTAIGDADRLRQEIVRGEVRVVEVGILASLWADHLEELDQVAHLFESLAYGMMLVVRPLRFRQLDGYLGNSVAVAAFEGGREMDTATWATTLPFIHQDVAHPGGQVWGTNQIARSLVIIDRFRMPSPHSITVGWSGSGKSYSAKLQVLRARYHGDAVAVVDPEGEYGSLATAGARVHRVGAEQLTSLSPFFGEVWGGKSPAEVQHRIDFLLRFFDRLVGGLAQEDRRLLLRLFWEEAMPRLSEPEKPGSDHFSAAVTPPSHSVALESLMRVLHDNLPHLFAELRPYLEQWAEDKDSNDLGVEDFVVFDLGRLSLNLKRAMCLVLVERLSQQTRFARRRLLVIDEAWYLLNDPDSAGYLEELFRRARKWHTALALCTQDIGDFVRSHAAEVCLRNAPLVLLLRQHPESLAEVQTLMHLSDGERDRLRQAGQGEGILLAGDDHVPIKIWASPAEAACIAGLSEVPS